MDPVCPSGFNPHLGWSSRCKNCYRSEAEHKVPMPTAPQRRSRHFRDPMPSNGRLGSSETVSTSVEGRGHLESSTSYSRSHRRESGNKSRVTDIDDDDDVYVPTSSLINSRRLLFEGSPRTDMSHHHVVSPRKERGEGTYLPPDMHSQYSLRSQDAMQAIRRSSVASASPSVPRKPAIYVTPSGSSTLPRNFSRSRVSPPTLVRVTASTLTTDSSFSTSPRMASNITPIQSSRNPYRGEVIGSIPTSNQRFAQAISGGESGYSTPSYGRSSPNQTTSTPRMSLSSAYRSTKYSDDYQSRQRRHSWREEAASTERTSSYSPSVPRRNWVSVSTPATPLRRLSPPPSPSSSVRRHYPITTSSSLNLRSRYPSYRPSFVVTSPPSISTSRRSSITSIGDFDPNKQYINSDPFSDRVNSHNSRDLSKSSSTGGMSATRVSPFSMSPYSPLMEQSVRCPATSSPSESRSSWQRSLPRNFSLHTWRAGIIATEEETYQDICSAEKTNSKSSSSNLDADSKSKQPHDVARERSKSKSLHDLSIDKLSPVIASETVVVASQKVKDISKETIGEDVLFGNTARSLLTRSMRGSESKSSLAEEISPPPQLLKQSKLSQEENTKEQVQPVSSSRSSVREETNEVKQKDETETSSVEDPLKNASSSSSRQQQQQQQDEEPLNQDQMIPRASLRKKMMTETEEMSTQKETNNQKLTQQNGRRLSNESSTGRPQIIPRSKSNIDPAYQDKIKQYTTNRESSKDKSPTKDSVDGSIKIPRASLTEDHKQKLKQSPIRELMSGIHRLVDGTTSGHLSDEPCAKYQMVSPTTHQDEKDPEIQLVGRKSSDDSPSRHQKGRRISEESISKTRTKETSPTKVKPEEMRSPIMEMEMPSLTLSHRLRDETPSSTGSGDTKFCCPIPTHLSLLKLRNKGSKASPGKLSKSKGKSKLESIRGSNEFNYDEMKLASLPSSPPRVSQNSSPRERSPTVLAPLAQTEVSEYTPRTSTVMEDEQLLLHLPTLETVNLQSDASLESFQSGVAPLAVSEVSKVSEADEKLVLQDNAQTEVTTELEVETAKMAEIQYTEKSIVEDSSLLDQVGAFARKKRRNPERGSKPPRKDLNNHQTQSRDQVTESKSIELHVSQNVCQESRLADDANMTPTEANACSTPTHRGVPMSREIMPDDHNISNISVPGEEEELPTLFDQVLTDVIAKQIARRISMESLSADDIGSIGKGSHRQSSDDHPVGEIVQDAQDDDRKSLVIEINHSPHESSSANSSFEQDLNDTYSIRKSSPTPSQYSCDSTHSVIKIFSETLGDFSKTTISIDIFDELQEEGSIDEQIENEKKDITSETQKGLQTSPEHFDHQITDKEPDFETEQLHPIEIEASSALGCYNEALSAVERATSPDFTELSASKTITHYLPHQTTINEESVIDEKKPTQTSESTISQKSSGDKSTTPEARFLLSPSPDSQASQKSSKYFSSTSSLETVIDLKENSQTGSSTPTEDKNRRDPVENIVSLTNQAIINFQTSAVDSKNSPDMKSTQKEINYIPPTYKLAQGLSEDMTDEGFQSMGTERDEQSLGDKDMLNAKESQGETTIIHSGNINEHVENQSSEFYENMPEVSNIQDGQDLSPTEPDIEPNISSTYKSNELLQQLIMLPIVKSGEETDKSEISYSQEISQISSQSQNNEPISLSGSSRCTSIEMLDINDIENLPLDTLSKEILFTDQNRDDISKSEEAHSTTEIQQENSFSDPSNNKIFDLQVGPESKYPKSDNVLAEDVEPSILETEEIHTTSKFSSLKTQEIPSAKLEIGNTILLEDQTTNIPCDKSENEVSNLSLDPICKQNLEIKIVDQDEHKLSPTVFIDQLDGKEEEFPFIDEEIESVFKISSSTSPFWFPDEDILRISPEIKLEHLERRIPKQSLMTLIEDKEGEVEEAKEMGDQDLEGYEGKRFSFGPRRNRNLPKQDDNSKSDEHNKSFSIHTVPKIILDDTADVLLKLNDLDQTLNSDSNANATLPDETELIQEIKITPKEEIIPLEEPLMHSTIEETILSKASPVQSKALKNLTKIEDLILNETEAKIHPSLIGSVISNEGINTLEENKRLPNIVSEEVIENPAIDSTSTETKTEVEESPSPLKITLEECTNQIREKSEISTPTPKEKPSGNLTQIKPDDIPKVFESVITKSNYSVEPIEVIIGDIPKLLPEPDSLSLASDKVLDVSIVAASVDIEPESLDLHTQSDLTGNKLQQLVDSTTSKHKSVQDGKDSNLTSEIGTLENVQLGVDKSITKPPIGVQIEKDEKHEAEKTQERSGNKSPVVAESTAVQILTEVSVDDLPIAMDNSLTEDKIKVFRPVEVEREARKPSPTKENLRPKRIGNERIPSKKGHHKSESDLDKASSMEFSRREFLLLSTGISDNMSLTCIPRPEGARPKVQQRNQKSLDEPDLGLLSRNTWQHSMPLARTEEDDSDNSDHIPPLRPVDPSSYRSHLNGDQFISASVDDVRKDKYEYDLDLGIDDDLPVGPGCSDVSLFEDFSYSHMTDGTSSSSLSSLTPSALSPTSSTSTRDRQRLVHELSQTLDVIEKLEDVLSAENVSPMGPVLITKLKQREKELVEWAADLQGQLEQSETACSKLLEENSELKQEIENLATEVVEMQDQFRDADMQEYRRMQRDLASLAKTCRNLQLKLRRTQQLRQKQKLMQEKLAADAAAAELAVAQKATDSTAGASASPADTSSAPEPETAGDLWKSAAIWCTMLVAGYQIMSRLKSGGT